MRAATAAYMLFSAPATAPIAMIPPTTIARMRMTLVMPPPWLAKYAWVVCACTFRRGSLARAALNAPNALALVSCTVTDCTLLPR